MIREIFLQFEKVPSASPLHHVIWDRVVHQLACGQKPNEYELDEYELDEKDRARRWQFVAVLNANRDEQTATQIATLSIVPNAMEYRRRDMFNQGRMRIAVGALQWKIGHQPAGDLLCLFVTSTRPIPLCPCAHGFLDLVKRRVRVPEKQPEGYRNVAEVWDLAGLTALVQ